MADDGGELPTLYEELLRKLYDGTAGPIDIATAVDQAQVYMQGVFKGFDGNFSNIDYATPDYEMLKHLQNNVYSFSAAKNWHMLKDLTASIVDGDKIRTFAQFRSEALGKLGVWVDTWAQTEYNAAVAGAQMAARWVDYQNTTLPNSSLQYKTVRDSRVREEHRMLEGVIRPLNDPFWNIYYPPNGWNCRCWTIQIPEIGNVTPEDKIEYPDIPKMFRTNLAKQSLVFPKGHPYFDGIPKKELNKFVKDNTPK